MALEVGISKAMLSKTENAQTSCSLSTLAALARGLDVLPLQFPNPRPLRPGDRPLALQHHCQWPVSSVLSHFL
ncbi:helix-turn-helix domain-containing protein [Nonomuraea sp. CA-143628]|uniref:helix-turn-helix domain-containing protein n=1 Tax=Nonomuraea sp. CA-143628 TaxID=3239997 RepID=UPI003D8BAEDC